MGPASLKVVVNKFHSRRVVPCEVTARGRKLVTCLRMEYAEWKPHEVNRIERGHRGFMGGLLRRLLQQTPSVNGMIYDKEPDPRRGVGHQTTVVLVANITRYKS